MKALVGAFNQEKALVGAFSVIVQPVVEPMDRFTALHKAGAGRARHHQQEGAAGVPQPRHGLHHPRGAAEGPRGQGDLPQLHCRQH